MRIVEVRDAVVPIASPMANAAISFSAMTVSLVGVETDVRRRGRPIVGYGFESNGRYAQQGLLRDRLIPRLLRAGPADLLDADGTNLDPARAWSVMMRDEKPGGHGERAVAVGVLDMALWDIVAKVEDVPLAVLLARRFGTGLAAAEVPVYAAGGYYRDGRGTAELCAEMAGYLDLGYTHVKLKIGGLPLPDDVARIEAVLRLLPSGDRLAVDANARLDLATALEYARALAPYGLRWFEEPVDPLDLAAHAEVAAAYPGPLATGENLFAAIEVANLLRFGGLRPDRDVLQMDPGLAYGLVEYRRMLATLDAHGWSRASCVPHGGHLMNLAIAAAFGLGGVESYPAVFAPFGGFADETPVRDGRIRPSDAPGIGVEAKAALWALARQVVGGDAASRQATDRR